MKTIKNITIIAVLIASVMIIIEMFHEKYEGLPTEKDMQFTQIEYMSKTQLSACEEARDMAERYRVFSMEENNQEKQSMNQQRMSTLTMFYQTFCQENFKERSWRELTKQEAQDLGLTDKP